MGIRSDAARTARYVFDMAHVQSSLSSLTYTHSSHFANAFAGFLCGHLWRQQNATLTPCQSHATMSERRGGFFNPSLDDMNKEILGWDVYTMLSGEAMYELKKVPVHFSSVDQYLDVFEPLLLEESRAQTLRSLQSHDVTEHQLKLQAVRGEPHEPFRIANFEAPSEATTKPLYFDTDLVLVSHEQLDLERVDDDGQLVPQQFHALALVNGSSPGTLALKLYLPEEGTSRLPSVHLKRLAVLRKVMVPSSGSWWIRKLGSMVTINREFQALYSVPELSLAPALLSPGNAAKLSAAPQSLQPPAALLRAIESLYNPSQLAAIRAALCGRGVSLIQGPPGTGKTATILGILSVLLASGQRSKDSAPPPPPPPPPPHTPARTAALLAAAAPRPAQTRPLPHPTPAAPWPALPWLHPLALWLPWPLGPAAPVAACRGGQLPRLNVAGAVAARAGEHSRGGWRLRAAARCVDLRTCRPDGPPHPAEPLGRRRAAQARARLRAEQRRHRRDRLAAAAAQWRRGRTARRRRRAVRPYPRPRLRPSRGRALAPTPRRALTPPQPWPRAEPWPCRPPESLPLGPPWLCRYVPSVVRVGPNVKETLHDVSLDTLAKRRQADSLDSSLSYDAAKMAVLNEASIVCTTLSCATRHTHLTHHTHHTHTPPSGPRPQPQPPPKPYLSSRPLTDGLAPPGARATRCSLSSSQDSTPCSLTRRRRPTEALNLPPNP